MKKYGIRSKSIGTILKNILVERERCGKILLWDFNPVDHGDRLYFNIATIVADLNREPIYLNMHLIDLDGVHESVPAFYDVAMAECKISEPKATKKAKSEPVAEKSTVKRLGQWVKKAVNCCIE